MKIEDLVETARNQLVTIRDDARLIEVAKLLGSGTDLVVVCDHHGVLCGVVTKTDVVNQISTCQGATCRCPVADVMTRDVAICQGPDSLADVSELMRGRQMKIIPVIDAHNQPIAVLSAQAILRALLGDAKYEEAQMIEFVKGFGYR